MTERSAKGLSGLEVRNAKGKRVGEIDHVLISPGDLRVAGFEVGRRPWAYLVRRKPVYLAFDRATLSAKRAQAAEEAAWGSKAAKRTGVGWDETVIWLGMPVLTESGADLGRVGDLAIGENGDILSVQLSGGLTADAALGIREVARGDVIGFDGECVRVADRVRAVQFSGGAAATAGKGTAVAADAATKAAKTAVVYGRAAAKVAAESETGQKALEWLRSAKDKTVDAMRAPDED